MKGILIELTLENASKLTLSTLHVVAVFQDGAVTRVLTSPGVVYSVTEPYAEVLAKLNEVA